MSLRSSPVLLLLFFVVFSVSAKVVREHAKVVREQRPMAVYSTQGRSAGGSGAGRR